MPVIKKANTTIGLPGTFSCRLQPNDTRDDVQVLPRKSMKGSLLRRGRRGDWRQPGH